MQTCSVRFTKRVVRQVVPVRDVEKVVRERNCESVASFDANGRPANGPIVSSSIERDIWTCSKNGENESNDGKIVDTNVDSPEYLTKSRINEHAFVEQVVGCTNAF